MKINKLAHHIALVISLGLAASAHAQLLGRGSLGGAIGGNIGGNIGGQLGGMGAMGHRDATINEVRAAARGNGTADGGGSLRAGQPAALPGNDNPSPGGASAGSVRGLIGAVHSKPSPSDSSTPQAGAGANPAASQPLPAGSAGGGVNLQGSAGGGVAASADAGGLADSARNTGAALQQHGQAVAGVARTGVDRAASGARAAAGKASGAANGAAQAATAGVKRANGAAQSAAANGVQVQAHGSAGAGASGGATGSN
ncbi:MAG: hypothetical protein ACJ8LG_00230 [Massilia sp.]